MRRSSSDSEHCIEPAAFVDFYTQPARQLYVASGQSKRGYCRFFPFQVHSAAADRDLLEVTCRLSKRWNCSSQLPVSCSYWLSCCFSTPDGGRSNLVERAAPLKPGSAFKIGDRVMLSA